VLLKRSWFGQTVDAYCECAPGNRNALLDRQIDFILRWSEIDSEISAAVSGEPPEDAAAGATSATSVFADVRDWLGAATEDRRRQMREVIDAGLMRWLATRDLGSESFATRDALIEAILAELPHDVDAEEVTRGLTPAQQDRFWANVDLLGEAAFLHRARAFDRLPDAQKLAYVDEQILLVSQWKNARQFFSSSADHDPSNPGILRTLARWSERASPEDRPIAERFSESLRIRLAWQRIRGFFQAVPKVLPGR
jgi:hypothetical protein